jgi:hypothetical protein
MLNSSINNLGLTQSLFNNIYGNANFNSEIEYIKVLSKSYGKNDFLNSNLNNNDFNNILSIPSINVPIDERLKLDFTEKNNKLTFEDKIKPLTTFLSSPLPEEELIIPITINNKIKKNSNKLKKNHKTYRVYKKLKSNSPKTLSSHKYSNKSFKIPTVSSRHNSNKFLTISNSI